MIGSFLDVSSTAVVNRVRHAVDLIETVEWEDHNEQGLLSVWGEQNIFFHSSSLLPKLPRLEDMAKKTNTARR